MAEWERLHRLKAAAVGSSSAVIGTGGNLDLCGNQSPEQSWRCTAAGSYLFRSRLLRFVVFTSGICASSVGS